MSYYVVRNKYAIPRFVFLAVASWMVTFGGVCIVLLLANWVGSAARFVDIINSSSGPLGALALLVLLYTVFGSFCLYMTMWVYWIAVERSSIFKRIGWFLVLLLGLVWGALIYAIFVWWKDIEKVDGPQPTRGPSVYS